MPTITYDKASLVAMKTKESYLHKQPCKRLDKISLEGPTGILDPFTYHQLRRHDTNECRDVVPSIEWSDPHEPWRITPTRMLTYG